MADDDFGDEFGDDDGFDDDDREWSLDDINGGGIRIIEEETKEYRK